MGSRASAIYPVVTQFSPVGAEVCGATEFVQAHGPATSSPIMPFVRGLLDRLLLACAVVAGGLVPGFIAQYRQRLGGRLDQARLDLQPWQRLADQYYQGDIERLIRYHLESSDPKFHDEGAVIRALVSTVQQLQSAVDALHGSLFHQAGYLALHLDPGLARATLNDWVPTFALSGEGLVFALAFAVLVWLLFHALWRLIALLRPRHRALRAPRARIS
jgi:Protein of unknown function (DUF2937)